MSTLDALLNGVAPILGLATAFGMFIMLAVALYLGDRDLDKESRDANWLNVEGHLHTVFLVGLGVVVAAVTVMICLRQLN